MRPVFSARCQHCRPTARDLESLIADPEKPQNARDGLAHAPDEILEVLERVQRVDRLPTLAGPERRMLAPHQGQNRKRSCADSLAQLRLELDLPHESGKHRNNIRCLSPLSSILDHGLPRSVALAKRVAPSTRASQCSLR